VAGFVSASQLAPTTVSQPLIPTPTATAMTPQASAVDSVKPMVSRKHKAPLSIITHFFERSSQKEQKDDQPPSPKLQKRTETNISADCNLDTNPASHVTVKDTVPSATHQRNVAKIVVRVLSPYYANQQIASKDLFKSLARRITHLLLEDNNGHITDEVEAEQISGSIIDELLSRFGRVTDHGQFGQLSLPST
jgi:hypothetical protein